MDSTNWDPNHLPRQRGKTFVVTGGNAGIGYFVSEQLAAAGARIVLACRSPQKADVAARSIRAHAPEADIAVVRLDLSSLASASPPGRPSVRSPPTAWNSSPPRTRSGRSRSQP
jgi:hypothetical protein